MTDSVPPSPAEAPPQALLPEAVADMARLFGQTPNLARLNEAAGLDPSRHLAVLDEVLSAAGLSGTVLAGRSGPRATELPALLANETGAAVCVLSQTAEGRYECKLPGISGATLLSAEQLQQRVPQGMWVATRPALHLDQRSLIYTLPQPRQWFWDVFNRNRPIFMWALFGSFALNLFAVLTPFYTMAVYDRVVPNAAMGSLGTLTVAVAVVLLFEFVTRVLRSGLLEVAARRIDVALSSQIYARALKLRAASRPASGGVLANTIRDFESIREFFATSTLTVLGDLPFLLLFLIVIGFVGQWLVLVPLVFIPIMIAVAFYAQRRMGALVSAGMQAGSQRTAHLFESINGVDTLKALGAETWSRRRWEGLTLAISENNLETREFMAKVNYINAGLMAAAGIAIIAVGAMMVAQQQLSVGQLIASSLLAARAMAPVNQIAALIVRWQQTKLSFEALDKMMAAPTDDDRASVTAPKLVGNIRFQDVKFSYPKSPPLLENFNLQIKAGERVGVIGKLGSGKSSLLRLILNQYEPDSGSVQIDDLVTTQLDALSLRRQIGYVPQDVTLFHGSIRENIELGRAQQDDAALLEAIRLSCLDEIVQQLPHGAATEVGERGERLSGGQRQAVAIARALLAQPRILLLDEPSSMMDPATEQKLIGRLRSLEDTTIVLVTHRMAMLALIDRLIVVDRGRIVADGPRDDVLKALTHGAGGSVAGAAAPRPGASMVGGVPAAPNFSGRPVTIGGKA